MPEGKIFESHEHYPKRVFIEVGTYSLPIPWQGSRKFEESETYIGIDVNPENLEHAQELSKLNFPGSKNLHFIRADGVNLPLPDKSVDEIFFGNVFGDNLFPSAKDKLIEEAKRVLKGTGRIIVKETNTPLPLEEFRDLLQKHGLYVEKGVTAHSLEWVEVVELFENIATNPKNIESAKKIDAFVAFVRPIPK